MRSPAFSLVEIVLALGIASFVLLSLLGLSSLTLNQSQQSKRDILWVNMAQSVTTELRGSKWSDLSNLPIYYFDAEGRRLTNAAGAFYQIEAKKGATQPPGVPAGADVACYNLNLNWPVGATNGQLLTLPFILTRHE